MNDPREPEGARETTEKPAGEAVPRKKRSRLKKRLLALSLSLAVSLLLIEVAARAAFRDPIAKLYEEVGYLEALHPDAPLGENAFYESLLLLPTKERPPKAPYCLDARVGYTHLPDLRERLGFPEAPSHGYAVRTNALGLRDDRVLVPKKKGVLRVLVVGDSYTFGTGVEREEAYPALLERELAARLAPREVEVVNAGCAGWGQKEEIALLESLGPSLEPDVVILQFCVTNDVLDDVRYREGEGLVPDPEIVDRLASSAWFKNPLARGSRAYRLLVWNVVRHFLRYRIMEDPALLARASALLDRAHRSSTKLGASYGLLVAPGVEQVRHTMADRLLETTRINQAVTASSRADGAPVVDPLPALEDAWARGVLTNFEVNRHWNAAGHRVVAESLLPMALELAAKH
ncbi:hypothetical protein HY251_22100 [bacterium]|nr:hypothetical protein [bacterium]